MKSPFRRRKRAKGRAPAKRKPVEPEIVDWPQTGTGRTSLMGAIRGDGETGAGFGGGMFEDLASAFEGSKKIKQEEQQREKLMRHDDHQVAGGGAADLDSGKIRIRRTGPVDPAPGTD
ncbi:MULTISPECIES: DUF6191 domain-containing protein [Thermomonosporaceae]|uniref:DUF6191 domain-containing protein n=1 Tax=Thermomonosporaceae TaxID=2012 RepID=UPI00255B0663|nr:MULTISPECIES: DUF6191 domain-containing protein [Thermomonosporaceae]MDL4775039.1 DUF6191 domain-containing protein [Actinomadura xylanilytica]